MNGELLKTQLLKIEPTLVEVANKLGMSKQNLDSKLSAADIKTGFIEQLAALYDKPISYFFGDREAVMVSYMQFCITHQSSAAFSPTRDTCPRLIRSKQLASIKERALRSLNLSHLVFNHIQIPFIPQM